MTRKSRSKNSESVALKPVRTIVVGTSLLEGSDEIVRAAADVACAVEGRLELVHSMSIDVLSPRFGTGWQESDFYLKWAEMQREELAAQIERLEISVPVRTTVTSGNAHQVIIDLADRVDADLIVIGASERGRFSKFLGGTTDRVLRRARSPVMVVRGEWTFPPRTVLAPVDFSMLSADAVDCGLAFLKQSAESDPHVEVFFVVSELQRSLAAPFTPEQVERMANQELERFAEEHLNTESGGHSSRVAVGVPSDQILTEVERLGADLVIIGTHGQGGVERALLGSVARVVATEANCPVLVVSPETALDASLAEAVVAQTAPRWSVPEVDSGDPTREGGTA